MGAADNYREPMITWDDAPVWLKGWAMFGAAVLVVWWYLYLFSVWPNAMVSALLVAIGVTPLSALASLLRGTSA